MTKNELTILQSLPLEIKVEKTKQRIREFVDMFGVDGVYISFSGGKDSTVLLDIARKLYPNIVACYIDTGLEYPEIKQFVKSKENVDIIRPKLSFKQVLEKYGYPVISKEQSSFIYEYRHTKSEKLKNIRINGNKYGRGKISKKWLYLLDAPFEISDKCCDIMKKNPAKLYEKQTGKMPLLGVMANESQLRMTHYLKNGCNSFDGTRPNSKPIGFWTEQDVLEYIIKHNLDIASVYGEIKQTPCGKYYTTGCERTGCLFCPYGIQCEKGENRYQRLERTHPQLHEYCINKLGFGEVLDYINVPYKKDQNKQEDNIDQND